MKKLLLLALMGLSFAAKAQCFTAILDTNHKVILGMPGTQTDSGYVQPITFWVGLQNCPWSGFSQPIDLVIFIPNAHINPQLPIYVATQVEAWIEQNFK